MSPAFKKTDSPAEPFSMRALRTPFTEVMPVSIQTPVTKFVTGSDVAVTSAGAPAVGRGDDTTFGRNASLARAA
jgi:hypothetical protein